MGFFRIVFRDDLFVALTSSRYTILSVDGSHFRLYNTMRPFGAFVTAVEFKFGLLVFGTDQGFVYAFTAKNTLRQLNLDLSKPAW